MGGASTSVCVIDLHYIRESFINTAVKVDGEGPNATHVHNTSFSLFTALWPMV